MPLHRPSHRKMRRKTSNPFPLEMWLELPSNSSYLDGALSAFLDAKVSTENGITPRSMIQGTVFLGIPSNSTCHILRDTPEILFEKARFDDRYINQFRYRDLVVAGERSEEVRGASYEITNDSSAFAVVSAARSNESDGGDQWVMLSCSRGNERSWCSLLLAIEAIDSSRLLVRVNDEKQLLEAGIALCKANGINSEMSVRRAVLMPLDYALWRAGSLFV